MAGDVRIGVVGCAGRMGQMNLRQIAATPGCAVAGAAEVAGHETVGRDAGELAGMDALGLPILGDSREMMTAVDVVLDFTIPEATTVHAGMAAEMGVALVAGTTGLSPEQEAVVAEAAQTVPVLRAANTSVGVTLLSALARKVAETLGPEFDIEIVEMHHRHKIDAPSGTALLLGESAAAGRNVNLGDVSQSGRDGHTGARESGAIGFAALRGGDIAGEHDVIFAAEGERLVLGHKATTRQIFAAGAVRAALWMHGKPPGLYSMHDVLGLEN